MASYLAYKMWRHNKAKHKYTYRMQIGKWS